MFCKLLLFSRICRVETPRSSSLCVFTQFSATVFFSSFPVQIYSNRELEEQLTKIRDALSDDKHDWELRVAAVRVPRMPPADPLSYRWHSDQKNTCVLFPALQLKKVRSLMLAGAAEFEGFPQQLRLLEASLKLSAKDLRSQVVREACITLG